MSMYKVILFMFYLTVSQCRLPDKVYCVNKDCDSPISKAKTLLTYNSPDPELISYRGNEEALVYMKSAGTNPDLWYAKIKDKSGFVSSKFLREFKIIEKSPQFIVPVEVRPKELETPDVQPDKVKEAHEVIEGTTIYTTAATDPDLGLTTEAPIVISENTTPQQNSNEDLGSTIETQTESSAAVSETSVEQKDIPSAEISTAPENSAEVDSPLVEVGNQLSVENNDSSDIESENFNKVDKPQVLNKSPEIVSENLEPVHRENTEVPNNVGTESISDEAITTENPKVPLESNVENLSEEIEEEPVQSTPPTQEPGLFGSLFSQDIESNEQNDKEEQMTETNSEQNSIEGSNEQVKIESSVENEANTLASTSNNPEEELNQNDPSNIIESNENSKIEPEPTITEIPPVIPETIPTSPPVENTPPVVENISPAINNIPPVMENIPPTLENTPPAISNIPPVMENIPPIMENIPPAINNIPPVMENVPPTTENPPPLTDTIPAVVSSGPVVIMADNLQQIPPIYQPQDPTTETLPPIFNNPTESAVAAQESSTPNYNSFNDHSQENTDSKEAATAGYYDSYTTDAPPLEDIYSSNSQSNFENTNGESNEETSSKGFLSSVYTTLADVWPSSTEAPPNLFKTEPTFEEEKVDGKSGFSFMSYFTSMYYSVMGVDEDIKALFPSQGETCYSDEYCDGKGEQSNRFLTFLLTAASSVLLFTLGYYYIDNKRQDGQLIGQINSLQRDLLFSTKECEILKEELSTTKAKLAGIEDSSFGMDDMVLSLKEEINELKATNDRLRNSLDDNEKLLRVSENTAGELQNTLGEVENTLSELLAERANSEEQINELNGKIQAFEEELISVSRDRDSYQLKYVSAETALEESKKYKKQLDEINQQLIEAKNTIELQKHEIAALKDAIHEMKNGAGNVDAASLIDHSAIKAQLSKALEEKKSLASKYEVEHTERKRLSDELQITQESLRNSSQQAAEAATRLEVLGKYFQEREGELLKELSAKESLYLSKQGESISTVEKIELMQQEVQRYKEKCDALTLELAEQETSRRTAVSEVEARAHNAWLEARAARREADAAKDEAAALRRKLASMSAASPHHKVSSPIELAEGALPPPLALPFLPPPLLPPLPRPPPLGRLPSPHPPRYGDRRYSPDSRYSPESRYSPDTVRYSPESRYSPRRVDAYSPRSRRRSRERYSEGRGSRTRNGPPDTETEYNSDSPSRHPRRRTRYSRHSGKRNRFKGHQPDFIFIQTLLRKQLSEQRKAMESSLESDEYITMMLEQRKAMESSLDLGENVLERSASICQSPETHTLNSRSSGSGGYSSGSDK